MKKIDLGNDCYLLYDQFLDNIKSKSLMDDVIRNAKWRDDKITFYGKEFEQPRKVAFYGDPGCTYTYSKIVMQPLSWPKSLYQLKNKLNESFSTNFNTCLVNYYRDGDDHMSWHSDDEKELGENPIIASISLGAERDFLFKPKNKFNTGQERVKIVLEHGSLLMMMGSTQHQWNHALPKRKRVDQPRMNLTFREVKSF